MTVMLLRFEFYGISFNHLHLTLTAVISTESILSQVIKMGQNASLYTVFQNTQYLLIQLRQGV